MMNYSPFSLNGKTILITGASSGIGRATAIECSKTGAKVIISGRNSDKLNSVFSELIGCGHLKIIADITKKEEVNILIESLPKLDGYVNNAGIEEPKPIGFIDENDYINIFNINTKAPILLTQLLINKKILLRESSIVFVSSIAGLKCASIGGSLYASSKSALNGFTKGAALDLASKSIRINNVCPGMVQTDLIKSILEPIEIDKLKREYPLKRLGDPKDIAYATIFLLSDASKWITGTNLVIDGGFTLK